MNKSVTVFAATIALSAIAATAAVAGPSAAGIQQSMKSVAGQNEIIHKVGSKKRKFVAGVIVGLGAAALVGASIRHGRFRHGRMCRRLRNRCWNGNDNACWKYDNRC